MLWCLSHCIGNEVGAVMKLPGPCRRSKLLHKKGKKDPQPESEQNKQPERCAAAAFPPHTVLPLRCLRSLRPAFGAFRTMC